MIVSTRAVEQGNHVKTRGCTPHPTKRSASRAVRHLSLGRLRLPGAIWQRQARNRNIQIALPHGSHLMVDCDHSSRSTFRPSSIVFRPSSLLRPLLIDLRHTPRYSTTTVRRRTLPRNANSRTYTQSHADMIAASVGSSDEGWPTCSP